MTFLIIIQSLMILFTWVVILAISANVRKLKDMAYGQAESNYNLVQLFGSSWRLALWKIQFELHGIKQQMIEKEMYHEISSVERAESDLSKLMDIYEKILNDEQGNNDDEKNS